MIGTAGQVLVGHLDIENQRQQDTDTEGYSFTTRRWRNKSHKDWNPGHCDWEQ